MSIAVRPALFGTLSRNNSMRAEALQIITPGMSDYRIGQLLAEYDKLVIEAANFRIPVETDAGLKTAQQLYTDVEAAKRLVAEADVKSMEETTSAQQVEYDRGDVGEESAALGKLKDIIQTLDTQKKAALDQATAGSLALQAAREGAARALATASATGQQCTDARLATQKLLRETLDFAENILNS